MDFDIEKFREVSRRARALEDKIMAECAAVKAGITREVAANIAAMVRQHDKADDRASRGVHVEPGDVERPEGYYHSALEPAEGPPFCDQCMGHHADGACPDDEPEDDDDDGYPGPCTDPAGHSWVCRDDNEEISYCENCGADGNA